MLVGLLPAPCLAPGSSFLLLLRSSSLPDGSAAADVPPVYFPSFPLTIPLCGPEHVLHPQEREEQDLGFTGPPCLLHDITLLGTVCSPTPSGLPSVKLHTHTGDPPVIWGLDTLTLRAAGCSGSLLQTRQDCQHTVLGEWLVGYTGAHG